MGAQNERAQIKKYYGIRSQFAKRLDTMNDRQVLAIYFRLKREGRIK